MVRFASMDSYGLKLGKANRIKNPRIDGTIIRANIQYI